MANKTSSSPNANPESGQDTNPTKGRLKETYRNATRFFDMLIDDGEPVESLHIVVVCHLVTSTRFFLNALSRLGKVALVLPKPKSANQDELKIIKEKFTTASLSREEFVSPDHVIELINSKCPSGKLILLDVGGYFAPHLKTIVDKANSKLVGVVEDTENGLQRYEEITRSGGLPVPVISVARSDLKNSEDFLVGQSIVFSAEALMRECDSILNGRRATVIGYGKIGRSIARHLHDKSVSTVVVENNPIRAIEAKAHGFHVLDKTEAIGRGNLVFCATGKKSLAGQDFDHLNHGSYVISVTSADDELDLSHVNEQYDVEDMSPHIKRYTQRWSVHGKSFYLLNKGNAVNFVHQGRLGPFIYPVQAEILEAARHLAIKEGALDNKIQELAIGKRMAIARAWMDAFRTVNAF